MDFRAERDRDETAIPRMPAGGDRARNLSPALEAEIADAYERCHPRDTFADLKKRARFSKEDRGLLKDWMSVFAGRES